MPRIIDSRSGNTTYIKGRGRKSDKSLERFETIGINGYDRYVDDIIKALEVGEEKKPERKKRKKKK